ncbi:MAG: T9SS type A sorting domain-containing protein, partial [Schleiferiaceae bacterium]
TKGFTNNANADNYDAGRIAELKRLANQLWSVDNDFYVILEHWGPNSEEKELSDHGMLLWGNAVHQYHEAAMGYTGDSDFKWGIYKERGWGNKHLITYSESHDEERSAYKIKTFGNSSGGYNTKNLPTMVDRKILTNAFLFTIPGPKMTYMFEELAYDESINDPCRICEKSILWSYYANTHRKRLYKYTAALINMRNTYGVFKTDNFIYALNGDSKRINLSVPDTNATVVGNFRVTSGDVYPNFQHTGTWYDYFTGDSIVVTNATAPLTYQPGEWHVYTDVNLGKASLIGMDEINGLPSTVALFPNPSNGIVELLVDTEEGTTVHYSLYDIMGREVENGRYNTSQNGIETLVLTSLPSGAYVLKVQFGSEIHTERIMIE